MGRADRRDRQEFEGEIAVRDGIDRIARGFTETKRLGRLLAVDAEAGSGKGGGAQRAFVHALDAVADTRPVAAEHLDIGHAVMTKGHRLGGLEMGEAGHDIVGMLFSLVEERLDQRGQGLLGALEFFLGPEAEIDGHLVVARARRVQATRGGADEIGKPRLDVHVNIFEPARK